MKEHGLLMSDPMVRACLAGVKTETRRLSDRWAKAQAGDKLWIRECFTMITCPECDGEGWIDDPNHPMHSSQTGNEDGQNWCLDCNPEGTNEIGRDVPIYRADDSTRAPKWTSSLLMPRAVCRLVYTLGEIRRDRLQDIDEAGAGREGMPVVTFDDLLELGTNRKLIAASASIIGLGDARKAQRNELKRAWIPGILADIGAYWKDTPARDRFRVVISLINGVHVWEDNPLVYVLACLERVEE